VNGQPGVTAFALPDTGSFSDWTSVKMGSLYLEAGALKIKILLNTGNFYLGTFHFVKNATALKKVSRPIPNI